MKAIFIRSCTLVTALSFAFNPVLAQQSSPPAAPASASANSSAKTFSQQDLDQLLAPIALYPDALLAQVLMAATYPLEVVEAARWSKANAKVTGKALEEAMSKQAWDPAVKSLTAVPQVLQQMNDKLDWTQKLGDAFLAQQDDLMATVQSLRAKAAAAGNLKSSAQQTVKTETQGSQTIYIVESPKPEVIYVPTYNPYVVYGTWWYPAPPYYMYPPAYVYPPGLVFATGVIVGAAIWGNCNWGWGHSHVNVNINHYNSFNRTNISNNNWNHNVDHRRGVSYKDKGVAQKYNRGGDERAAKSREEFRGRSEGGHFDNNKASPARNNANRTNDATRDRAASSSHDRGGLSGVDKGAATREASARGHASRANTGHARASSASANRGGGGGGGHRGGGGRHR